MIEQLYTDASYELAEIELAELQAEKELEAERQKWQKGTECNCTRSE